MKKVLIAAGLLALSASSTLAAMSGSDVKKTTNALIGWAGVYQETCGLPVPPEVMSMIRMAAPMADQSEVWASAMEAQDLIKKNGKDWWCGKVSDMYASSVRAFRGN